MTEPNGQASRSPSRRTSGAPDFLVRLDPGSAEPLYRQVYDALRQAILEGRLPAGRRIPSTRVLAAELGIARNTVTLAVEQLRSEGYLATNRGGGTRVRQGVPDAVMTVPAHREPSHPAPPGARRSPEEPPADPGAGPALLSGRGALLVAAGRSLVARGGTDPVPFRLGTPAAEAFPSAVWARLTAQQWRRGRVPLGEGDPGGHPALRAAVAEYVGNARGVRCTAEQVLVVSGTLQGLDLVARVLLEPGDDVWVEDPGYTDAVAVLGASGARPVPVPVDGEGLDVAAGERLSPGARLAYVTPSHQFPLGAVMSVARRMALLAWARGARAWVFEDDYDSEFRYTGRPLPSLQGLEVECRPPGHPARVVYAGTFNKTLVPGLRVGYLVAPAALAEPLRAARAAIDRQPSSFTQVALADFIGEGHYGRHLRRARALYAERQAALLAAAGELLGGRLALEPDAAGLHLVGRLPPGVDDVAAAAAAREAGVEVYPLSRFRLAPRGRETRGGLLLGYAPFDGAAIREGVRRLATALEGIRDR